MDSTVEISKHILVPKHTKISEEEIKVILDKYNISLNQLPKILKSDPAIKNLNAEVGDVIKIERDSPTMGTVDFFRAVIHG